MGFFQQLREDWCIILLINPLVKLARDLIRPHLKRQRFGREMGPRTFQGNLYRLVKYYNLAMGSM